jgi:uncharacterized protein YwqG
MSLGVIATVTLTPDYPMHWLWGDCGAVYCFIRPSDLDERAWDRAEFDLECH